MGNDPLLVLLRLWPLFSTFGTLPLVPKPPVVLHCNFFEHYSMLKKRNQLGAAVLCAYSVERTAATALVLASASITNVSSQFGNASVIGSRMSLCFKVSKASSHVLFHTQISPSSLVYKAEPLVWLFQGCRHGKVKDTKKSLQFCHGLRSGELR